MQADQSTQNRETAGREISPPAAIGVTALLRDPVESPRLYAARNVGHGEKALPIPGNCKGHYRRYIEGNGDRILYEKVKG